MYERIRLIFRWLLTGLLIVAALFAGYTLWRYYNRDPWTRDGRVRADTAQIAPDVSGLVATVDVHDNEVIQRGDILFTIDRSRFELAKDRAEANVKQLDVEIAESRRENLRNVHLGDLVSDETRQQSQTRLDQQLADRAQAIAALDEAKLNLVRTQVRTPIDGVVTNIELQPGDYATAGRPEFALIALNSLRVEGYFEETKLGRIHVGDRAEVTLMGDNRVISGHVESIAAGVEDHDRADSARLLANINPTFNWVRLAQRIPVRVKVDNLPKGLALVAGRTATVRILPDTHGQH